MKASHATQPSWGTMGRVFGGIGLLSFGGPAAQIALMHRELVEGRRWLDEGEYLSALSLCMLLPGPEAMQLATYAGWRLRGVAGGLLAGALFVLPGATLILALAAAYAAWGQIAFVSALFYGVKASVAVIVIEALLRVARRALTTPLHRVIAALSFCALFFLALPFPLVICLAAGVGAWMLPQPPAAPPVPIRRTHLLPVLGAGLFAWGLPLAALWLTGQDFLLTLGLFFSKLALVTFGGAYAVLAYMAQEVVQHHAWITTAQMMDALGLAETTPGPLILVTEFVGYLAGYQRAGVGLAAAALTLWVTFVPCFLWIFAFAPYVDWIATRPRLQTALSGVTAAVVGVIGNLALWFALHVLFRNVSTVRAGPLTFAWPEGASLDPTAAVIALVAGFLLLRWKQPLWLVLAISALAGIILPQIA